MSIYARIICGEKRLSQMEDGLGNLFLALSVLHLCCTKTHQAKTKPAF